MVHFSEIGNAPLASAGFWASDSGCFWRRISGRRSVGFCRWEASDSGWSRRRISVGVGDGFRLGCATVRLFCGKRAGASAGAEARAGAEAEAGAGAVSPLPALPPLVLCLVFGSFSRKPLCGAVFCVRPAGAARKAGGLPPRVRNGSIDRKHRKVPAIPGLLFL
jgi:hypothetical protein